jgi:hypothetical protein
MPVAIAGLGNAVDKGDEVTLRFRPTGVGRSNANRALDALRLAVIGTRHFESPKYLGWGEGGTLVYRGKVKSSNYSLQQIADFMPGVARTASRSLGKQIAFLSAKDNSNNEAVASAGGASGGGGGGTTGGGTTGGGTTGGGTASTSAVESQRIQLASRLATIRRRVERAFGTERGPELSWSAVRSMNLATLVSAPQGLARSAILYAVGIVTKQLAAAQLMIDGARAGVPNAVADARSQLDTAAMGLSAIETALDAVPGSSVGGLGFLPLVPLAALYAIWRFFSASDDAAQRTTAYCQRKLEVTGQGCTPQEFTEIERRYAEGSESGGFWDKITDQLAGTFASILKYAAIGGAVLVGTFIVWQAIVGYTAYRTTKAVVSTPEGRRLAGAAVGAAVGGPAGARAGLALASNHRHRRVSRRRRQGGR